MILKTALHVHTNLSDGALSPDEVIQNHIKAGFHVIAITDHDTLWDFSKLQSTYGIVILQGNEVSFKELNGWHVGHIYGTNGVLRILNHPIRYGLTLTQAEDICTQYGFDAIECTQHGTYYGQYESGKFPVIVSDDSHNFNMINDSYILVESPTKSPDDIICAIKRRNFTCEGIEYNAGKYPEFITIG